MLTRDLAQPFQKTRLRRHQTHIPRSRLDNDTGDLPWVLFQGLAYCCQIIERHGQGMAGQSRWHPWAVRHAEGHGA